MVTGNQLPGHQVGCWHVNEWLSSFTWTQQSVRRIQSIRASQAALLTLDMRKSSSVRRAIEVKLSGTGRSRLSGAATAALMIADCGATLTDQWALLRL